MSIDKFCIKNTKRMKASSFAPYRLDGKGIHINMVYKVKYKNVNIDKVF